MNRIFCVMLVVLLTEISLCFSSCTGEVCEMQENLFSWIRNNGGNVSHKIEFSTGSDPSWTIRGMFATEDIKKGEAIVALPENLRICRPGPCSVVHKLTSEIKKGKNSYWLPYIEAMKDHNVDIPAVWTPEERSLLDGLYPFDWTRHIEWFESHCDGNVNDETSLRAMLLVVARSHGLGDDACLSPVYDSLNHDNEGLNTMVDFDGDMMLMLASRDIPSGQQLFNTFGAQGVGRFVRDYGFMGQWPRVWEFKGAHGDVYSFELHLGEEGDIEIDINPSGNHHQLDLHQYLDDVVNHLAFVKLNEPGGFSQETGSFERGRMILARQYREGYINALEIARSFLKSRISGASEM